MGPAHPEARNADEILQEGLPAPGRLVPEGYRPTEDETYMNPDQLDYFRRRLIAWREELLDACMDTLGQLKEERIQGVDPIDMSAEETSTRLSLRTRERYRKLIFKIDESLERIRDGTYGYCVETGEEIGIGRLEARPIACLCIDAQRRHERRERLKRR